MSRKSRAVEPSINGDDVWDVVRASVKALGNPQQGMRATEVRRFRRLMDFRDSSYENQSRLDRAWRTLRDSARSVDSLLSLFLVMPDAPSIQPFPALSHGPRALDPAAEAQRYAEIAAHADALRGYFSPSSRLTLERLLADQWRDNAPPGNTKKRSQKAGEYAEKARNIWPDLRFGEVMRGLRWISYACKGADPHQWYLTQQPLAKDAEMQTYAKQVANLNCYLFRAQHSALATLANANAPNHPLDRDRVRKAWDPPDWWSQELTRK
ncbi:MAG: hypothetical protein ACK4F6_16900 [Hylemonella sp.]